MLSKFIFSLLDFILLLIVSVMLAFLPVWNYLFGSGTPLKACTLPPLWALIIELNKTLYSGLMAPGPGPVSLLNNKLNLDASGEPPFIATIGLPYRLGAMQSPSGLYA